MVSRVWYWFEVVCIGQVLAIAGTITFFEAQVLLAGNHEALWNFNVWGEHTFEAIWFPIAVVVGTAAIVRRLAEMR